MHALPIIATEEQLIHTIQQSDERPLWLFKYSSNCGSSRIAHIALNQFLTKYPHLSSRFSFAVVRVLEEKALSEKVTKILEIPHKSPQILLVHKQKVVWNSSHQQINSLQLSQLAQHFLQQHPTI
ncbi:bacillithiol system redox-active protein YtxJ [Paenibacillus alvei]|uniref:Bacillithiol system redox-active protein YtxJ n=1 Tax=Paenibacillus alvei TaxID=44250 RepID=A0ABT4H4E6_PAEAL|nr:MULTISPECIES: bacillithiol system redox-active protein YtxJ [Paenibacillus]EJW16624.1 bacillithiol system protein YtxJ [Paenibacillus alvei DSM 29]MCY7484847.1 bacillithiol system redox-active protein YtxJ [Paenibacillus alvei]MCY9541643.1 bacillithiol system redox-active protein YtxJ [Paenibacillus alvei]MCY9704129.1 bacillithiol system redox-active protein YtxJ [Paenibacillus alvei]MCY9736856.1 bacillithiol system redox-active protein YtxJ [Paenibacillus alvei]